MLILKIVAYSLKLNAALQVCVVTDTTILMTMLSRELYSSVAMRADYHIVKDQPSLMISTLTLMPLSTTFKASFMTIFTHAVDLSGCCSPD